MQVKLSKKQPLSLKKKLLPAKPVLLTAQFSARLKTTQSVSVHKTPLLARFLAIQSRTNAAALNWEVNPKELQFFLEKINMTTKKAAPMSLFSNQKVLCKRKACKKQLTEQAQLAILRQKKSGETLLWSMVSTITNEMEHLWHKALTGEIQMSRLFKPTQHWLPKVQIYVLKVDTIRIFRVQSLVVATKKVRKSYLTKMMVEWNSAVLLIGSMKQLCRNPLIKWARLTHTSKCKNNKNHTCWNKAITTIWPQKIATNNINFMTLLFKIRQSKTTKRFMTILSRELPKWSSKTWTMTQKLMRKKWSMESTKRLLL